MFCTHRPENNLLQGHKWGHKWGTHLNFFKPVSFHQSGSAAVAPPGRTDDHERVVVYRTDKAVASGRPPLNGTEQDGRDRLKQTVSFKNVYFPIFSFRLFTNISQLFKIFSSLPPIMVYDIIRISLIST